MRSAAEPPDRRPQSAVRRPQSAVKARRLFGVSRYSGLVIAMVYCRLHATWRTNQSPARDIRVNSDIANTRTIGMYWLCLYLFVMYLGIRSSCKVHLVLSLLSKAWDLIGVVYANTSISPRTNLNILYFIFRKQNLCRWSVEISYKESFGKT